MSFRCSAFPKQTYPIKVNVDLLPIARDDIEKRRLGRRPPVPSVYKSYLFDLGMIHISCLISSTPFRPRRETDTGGGRGMSTQLITEQIR